MSGETVAVELDENRRRSNDPVGYGIATSALCAIRRPEIGSGTVLLRKHDCPEFMPWVPGATAVEHWRMRNQNKVLRETFRLHKLEIAALSITIAAIFLAPWLPTIFGTDSPPVVVENNPTIVLPPGSVIVATPEPTETP
jgi:hypothetical protein